ncbi:MAG: hypothetical protein RR547_05375, partial [Raoultibacter sp.]
TVASITYILKNGGDGYTMFKQSDPIVDEVGLDYEALITYIQHDLGGVIGSGYENEDGSGRILVKLGPDPVPTPIPTPTPVPSVDPTTASVSTLARTGDSDPQLVIAVSSLALSGFVGLVVSSALIGRTCARGRAGVSRARIRLRNAR